MAQYNIPDAPNPEAGSRGCFQSGCGCSGLVGAFLICFGLLVLAISFMVLSSSINKLVSFFQYEEGENKPAAETVVGKPKVVKIDIEGAIVFQDQKRSLLSRSEGGAEEIIEDLKMAREDKDVRGILLQVNSPGGEITACDLIDQEIRKFRSSSSNRFVVTYMRGLAASGGYYVSAHSDRIVISPTTITGSIGVLMSGLNFEEAAEKLGIKSVTFTSGPMKDMLNPMKGVSPAVSNIVQGTVDELHSRFVDIIADGRHMPVEKVRELADGRIYTASQSVANGLTDKVGYMEEVKAAFAELGISDYELVEYQEYDDVMEKLRKAFSVFGGFYPQIKVPENGWRLRFASPFMNE